MGTAVNRRGCLTTAAVTAALFGLPRFSSRAQATRYAETAPPVFDDYALNPVRAWLQRYVPPSGYDPLKDQTLEYTGLMVHPPRGKVQTNVFENGRLSMKRMAGPDGVRYEIDQTLEDSGLRGTMQCRAGGFRAPVQWEFTASPNGDSRWTALSALTYRGTVDAKAGKVRLSTGKMGVTQDTKSPATLLWNLLDSPALQGIARERPYDLFWEGMTFRPGQTLTPDGFTVLPGSNTPVKTVMLHGPASMPLHFLVTEAGVPLGVTGFLCSWMLTKIG